MTPGHPPIPKPHEVPASMDRGTGATPQAGNRAFHILSRELGV